MIARIWRGITRESDKDTYFAYLQVTGLKEYAAIPGNRGVWTLRRVADGKCEFTLISLWDSMDAIKAFAGPDFEKAVFYPEDDQFLVERGPRVQHYEVLSTPDRTVEAAPEI
jgi:heme-degrading monooxygenase HmoA